MNCHAFVNNDISNGEISFVHAILIAGLVVMIVLNLMEYEQVSLKQIMLTTYETKQTNNNSKRRQRIFTNYFTY
jgi:hypothetical protein